MSTVLRLLPVWCCYTSFSYVWLPALLLQIYLLNNYTILKTFVSAFIPDASVKVANLAFLSSDLAVATDRMVAIIYGAAAAGLQNNIVVQKLVKPLPFYAQKDADILYKSGTCLRSAGTACLPTSSEYYQVFRNSYWAFDIIFSPFIPKSLMLLELF